MEPILTFDKLPEAVAMLTKEVSELKRLYFSRTELLEYLKEGRKKSNNHRNQFNTDNHGANTNNI